MTYSGFSRRSSPIDLHYHNLGLPAGMEVGKSLVEIRLSLAIRFIREFTRNT